MQPLTSNQIFNQNKGKAFNGVKVSLGTGTAVLESANPDGWDVEEAFTVSATKVFEAKLNVTYRMVLSGDAKAYLV